MYVDTYIKDSSLVKINALCAYVEGTVEAWNGGGKAGCRRRFASLRRAAVTRPHALTATDCSASPYSGRNINYAF